MLKAIIFDVDGVLVDSKEANIAFFQNLLKKAGYPKASRKEILECFHLALWQSLEKLTGSNDQVEIKRIWDIAQDSSLRNPSLFNFPEKLEDILGELHKKYKLAIVTSRIRVGMDDIFSAKDMRHLFDSIITFEDYKKPKPSPDPLLTALKKLKILPRESVYIGDSESDIIAAKAAGIRSIHLAPNKHKDATAGIKVFQELLPIIESLK